MPVNGQPVAGSANGQNVAPPPPPRRFDAALPPEELARLGLGDGPARLAAALAMDVHVAPAAADDDEALP